MLSSGQKTGGIPYAQSPSGRTRGARRIDVRPVLRKRGVTAAVFRRGRADRTPLWACGAQPRAGLLLHPGRRFCLRGRGRHAHRRDRGRGPAPPVPPRPARAACLCAAQQEAAARYPAAAARAADAQQPPGHGCAQHELVQAVLQAPLLYLSPSSGWTRRTAAAARPANCSTA